MTFISLILDLGHRDLIINYLLKDFVLLVVPFLLFGLAYDLISKQNSRDLLRLLLIVSLTHMAIYFVFTSISSLNFANQMSVVLLGIPLLIFCNKLFQAALYTVMLVLLAPKLGAIKIVYLISMTFWVLMKVNYLGLKGISSTARTTIIFLSMLTLILAFELLSDYAYLFTVAKSVVIRFYEWEIVFNQSPIKNFLGQAGFKFSDAADFYASNELERQLLTTNRERVVHFGFAWVYAKLGVVGLLAYTLFWSSVLARVISGFSSDTRHEAIFAALAVTVLLTQILAFGKGMLNPLFPLVIAYMLFRPSVSRSEYET